MRILHFPYSLMPWDSHEDITNFSNIARDCGVDSKTVKEYYQILVDTLMGVLVPPFRRRQNRQVITKASKFYLFDVGVAGTIIKRRVHMKNAGKHLAKLLSISF